MSYSCQNYIFEIPTKTNNSQTFVQTNNLGPLAWARFFFFFEILFLLRLFGFFRVRSIFFHVLQYLSMYLPPTPCFSRFSRSGPVFPGFPGAVGTLRHRGGPTTSKHTHTHTHTHTQCFSQEDRAWGSRLLTRELPFVGFPTLSGKQWI